ncbi:discoidin domain-containing protein [Luteolibacter arcticus]|uniref:Discoidin domain-containing protein n=1 Tax=Luteolibacter arcticus TaxID=1581411 RepID=A0ABT3GQC9_9BACT|nr:discoidin domain-containing protein [Luteolibacter arcticus]MCW1925689.1 discoidin domain-containing protein [Luteolibacter arcticus]
MGDTAQAARYTVDKLRHPGERFPAFYHVHYGDGREGFCQAPDADHGGVAMTALQEMIMQVDGRRILLGGAWPADWTGNFKLHAPYQTVVEGHVADGKVVVDKVTPETRRKDIEIFPLKTLPLPAPPPLSAGKAATASSVYRAGHEADKAFDGNPQTRWAARETKAAWIAVDLGRPMEVSRVVIQETSYPRVSRFAFEAQEADSSWKALATGTTLGADMELSFAPVTAQVFRLNVLDASDSPTVEEVLLYPR